MTDLGLLKSYRSGFARVVNERGEILVNLAKNRSAGSNSHDVRCEPFLWAKENGFVRLPVPSGYNDVRGVGLNNHGVVLLNARQRPSLESKGYLVSHGKLLELPNATGMASTRYSGLNDRDWLVGQAIPDGLDPKDRTAWRGFVAKPVW